MDMQELRLARIDIVLISLDVSAQVADNTGSGSFCTIDGLSTTLLH